MKEKHEEFNYKRYSDALETSLGKVSAKNKVVTVDQLQLETAIPQDLITEVLDQETVKFPERVDKIIDEKEGKVWKK